MASSLVSALTFVDALADHVVALAAASNLVATQLLAVLLISAIVFAVHVAPSPAEDDPDKWSW